MPVTNYFLDRYFARGLSELQRQILPPVPAYLRSFSVQQFAMNAVFSFKLEEKARARSFNARAIDRGQWQASLGSSRRQPPDRRQPAAVLASVKDKPSAALKKRHP